MTSIEFADGILELRLGADQNLLTHETLAASEAALMRAETDSDVHALVTIGGGKHYSTGLDLSGLTADPEHAQDYLDRVLDLLVRLLTAPVATVAAVNGHAFGAGAMLVLAHDAAVMRADRGFWCLPEVDLGLTFAPLMSALVTARLAPRVAHQAMTSGRRYSGPEALAAGIVDATADAEAVLTGAHALARENGGKPRQALAAIKANLHADVLARRPGRSRA
jgi:enoyl-CoA hydratase/carnithine racemase